MKKRTIRIFSTGDWHDCRSYHDQVAPAVEQFVAAVEAERPDAVLHTGDLFNRSGEHSALELYFIRTALLRMESVCPVVVIDGNHDRNNIATDPDSLTGALLHGDSDQVADQLFVATRSRTIGVPGPGHDALFSVVCLPYPSRVATAEGSTMSPEETAAKASEQMARDAARLGAEALDDFLNHGRVSVLMFHGTVDGGVVGPEQVIETDGEVVLRQTELPAGVLFCVGGHLHVPQQVGRLVYTGSIACPTWHERSVRPSFLETLLVPDGDPTPEGAEWWCPNDGLPVDVTGWRVFCRRRPITVAQPLLNIDLRGKLPLDASQGAILARIDERAPDISGARVRLRVAVRKALRAAYSAETLEERIMAHGAASARAVIEYRPDTVYAVEGDLNQSTDIIRGINLFVDANPEMERIREALVAEARSMEATLPPEAMADVDPIDYRLLSLKWSNWKQHGQGSLNCEAVPGIVSIEGANWAGKSNLAELEAFILWGAVRSDLGDDRGRGNLLRAVRNGQRLCTAEAVIESGGQRWRVVRTVKVTGDAENQKATGSVAIERWDGTRWVDRSSGVAAQKTIVQRAGKLKTYLDTRLSSQQDIDRIFSLGLADLQRTIHEACQLSAYEIRHKAAEPAERAAREALDRARSAVDEARRAAAGSESVAIELAAAIAARDSAATTLETAEAARVAAEAELSRIVSLAGATEGLRQAVSAAEAAFRAAIEAQARATKRYRDAVSRHHAAAAEAAMCQVSGMLAEKARADTARLQDLEAQKLALMESKQRRDEALSRANAAEMEIQREKMRLQAVAHEHAIGVEKLKSSILAADAVVRREISDHGVKKSSLQTLASTLESSSRLIETVPCSATSAWSGGPVPDVDLSGTCPLLRKAHEDRDRLDTVRADIAAMGEEPENIETLRGEAIRLRRELQLMVAPETDSEALRAATASREACLAESAAVGYDESEMAAVVADIAALVQSKPRERLASAEEAAAKYPGLVVVRDEARAERKRAAADRRHATIAMRSARAACNAASAELRVAMEQHEPAVREARSVLAARVESVREWGLAHQAAVARVGFLEGQAERLREAEVRAQAAEAEARVAEERMAVVTAYRSAVSRTGIPYLIGERALPTIEERANTYLSETGKQVRFVVDGSDFDVYFVDDTGEHHRSEASGFDKAAMGIACRLAMADTARMFGGSRARHYIQDEGFGAAEQGNVLILVEVLRAASREREQVFVISHVPAVHHAADHRIRVNYDPVNGSSVTGPGTSGAASPEPEFALT